MSESSNFSELKNKINNWDLEAEEMLLRKMKAFTDGYLDEFNQFSKNMDTLDLNLELSKIDTYKTYSQLKMLSNNQFMEEILDDNVEQEEEEPKDETNNSNDIVINDIESKKIAINLSLQKLEEILSKKGKDREQIEDDTVSVSSSKLNLDNFTKVVRLPFVIGTEDFKKDKTLGLTIDTGENDEEEEEKNKKDENEIEAEVE